MSFYNLMHGVNPFAKFYLAILGFDFEQIPRFRDAYLAADEKETRIVIHTRTGGGNREAYHEANTRICENPNYLYDRDDEFDPTYANFYFAIPDEFKHMMVPLIELDLRKAPKDAWPELLEKIKEGADDAKTQRAMEVGKEIMEKLGLIFEDGKK